MGTPLSRYINRENGPVAAYLCASAGCQVLEEQRHELREFASGLELPAPVFFEDVIRTVDDERPALSCLLARVSDGIFRVVLITAGSARGMGGEDAYSDLHLMVVSGCTVTELPDVGALHRVRSVSSARLSAA
ncbi:hypothetical protein OG259_37360 [Streptomyces sp. NBC_00250]|uniref:hypothetical protein n=1 Tax=Streptomyces sp. NBC_00250 TaxID=2903641 RepID=UPI002E2E5317|nr:hypothetical protein [Streptomyces sp. NBC_00250]